MAHYLDEETQIKKRTMNIAKTFIIGLLALHTGSVNAQTVEVDSSLPEPKNRLFEYNYIETLYEAGGIAGSGDYAPMWHFSNRQGLGSQENGWAYARVGVGGNHGIDLDILDFPIHLDWKADIVGGYCLTSNVSIQQAYADLRYRAVHISIGQKERWGELRNPRLSTGALTESGNARPIPQVRIELPRYACILRNWLYIRGHIAYGRFTDGNWQQDFAAANTVHSTGVRYHSKAGFLRIGNEEAFPLTAEMGLHMATQFGGNCYNSRNIAGNNHKNPTRLKDYLMAFIPTSGDSQYDGSDQANVAGNVLGSWLGALTWNSKEWKLRVSYEHMFDGHSQMFWEYGLWTEQLLGIELELKRSRWVKSILIEYFNLKNQSGPVYHDSTSKIPDQISCKDNNYNHGGYPGWFNYGMTIGSPLCTSPVYNKDNVLVCYNNRVEAFHFGIEGKPLEWLGYRALLTKSNNWGSYSKPFKDIKTNCSGLVELTFMPNRLWSIMTSFALDKGELYGNNYGGMITITRNVLTKIK